MHVLRGDGLAGAPVGAVAGLRRLAEDVGATFHTVVGDHVPTALLEFARGVDATQLVIGTSRRSRLARVLVESIGARVVQDSGHIDVHMVTHPEAGRGIRLPRRFSAVPATPPGRWDGRWAVLLPLAAVGIGILGRGLLGLSTDVVLFFLATVIAALVGGLGPALLAAVASGAAAQLLPDPAAVHLHHRRAGERHHAGGHGAGGGPRRPRRRPRRTPGPAGRAGPGRGRPARLVLPHRARPQRPAAPAAGADPGGVRPHVGGDPAAQGGPLDGLRVRRTGRVHPPRGRRRRRRGRPRHPPRRSRAARWLPPTAGCSRPSRARPCWRCATSRSAAEAAEAKRRADATELRSALLSAVGHDLRTPLASIKAAAGQPARPEPAALRGRPQRAGRHGRGVGRPAHRRGRQPARLVPARHRRRHAGAAARRLRRGRARSPCAGSTAPTASGSRSTSDLPEVLADPGLLERVVANLVDNALRHGRGSPVTLRGSAHADRVELRVVDAGPGVPRGGSERLFAPFQRLGDREPRGLGLGLSVARGFTEAMGGTLTAEDTPGGGLTMVVSLPAATGPAARSSLPNPPSCAVTRVLIVDDDTQLLRALRINLTARGYDRRHRRRRADGAARRGRPPARRRRPRPRACPTSTAPTSSPSCARFTAVPIIVLSARTDSSRQGARPRPRRRRLRHQAVRRRGAGGPAAGRGPAGHAAAAGGPDDAPARGR